MSGKSYTWSLVDFDFDFLGVLFVRKTSSVQWITYKLTHVYSSFVSLTYVY